VYLMIRAGLLEPKHRRQLGDAVWLYLWLHTRVRMTGPLAGSTPPDTLYHHEAARQALGYEDVRQVKRHFRRLVEGGYVTVARRQRGLEIALTRYLLPTGERVAARIRSDASVTPEGRRSDTSVPSGAGRSDTCVPPEVTHPSPHTTIDVTSHQISSLNSRNRKRVGPPSEDSATAAPVTPVAPTASVARVSRAAPAPGPSKSGEVIDLLRARSLPDALSARDHAAVKGTALTAGQIVEAFEAAFRGRWGDPWLHDNLCVRLVIERWAGYQARRSGGQAPRPFGRPLPPSADPANSTEERFRAFEKYR
jgi:hypothetical protein